MARHGASPETLDSPLVRGVYDLVFGFQDGDPARPRFAAGLGLFLSGKLFFEYRGSIFWKPQGGDGRCASCAPLYEALTERGVRFEFFSRVEAVRPVRGRRSHRRGRDQPAGQAARRPGRATSRWSKSAGLPCFPSQPNLPTTSIPGSTTNRSGRTAGDDHTVVLETGTGLRPDRPGDPGRACFRYICSEIIEANPRWRSMVDHLGTVATQVFQLWLSAEPDRTGMATGRE